jgi:hypothetical protein
MPTGDRVIGYMCTRTGRGKGCDPITEADAERGHDLAWLEFSTRYTQDRQTPLCQYPCPGGCGGWVPYPSACLGCWFAANPIDEATARARGLPADHPRRTIRGVTIPGGR